MKSLALLLLPLLVLAGCRDNQASVQIQEICAPTKTCTFAGKCDAAALGNPVWDPAITSYVTLILQVENQLPDNSDKDLKRLNTNDAHIDGAEVSYSGLLGGSASVVATGDVPASGVTVVWVDIIPAKITGAIVAAPGALPAFPDFAEIGTRIKLRGYYDDGTRFETGEFPVSVQVARGTSTRPDAYVPSPANTTPGLACAAACPHIGQWPAACP